MKKFLSFLSKIIFSRTLIVFLMIFLQAAVFPLINIYLNNYFPAMIEAMSVVAGIIIIIIVNQDEPAEFKLTWAGIMCLFPVLGVLIYLFIKSNWGMVGLRKKVNREINETKDLLYMSEATQNSLKKEDKSFQGFARYMDEMCGFPVYHNTRTHYFPSGEEKIADLLKELKTAKKYIFMEYFIIDHGEVWDSVLDVLKEKVKEGVEVRVMYDGLCSLFLLPYYYPRKLRKYGIEAKMFAPVVPFLSTTQNNRDHRKIVVIDGRVAYTGGVNLADEYVNKKVRFGHWKDSGIKIEGRGVMSLTLMFLQNWNVYGKENLEYEKYLHENSYTDLPHIDDGFVIPYGDTPTMKVEIAKTVYESILNNATSYIHIMTPYFIVDREFFSLMRYASERGIDVKMILPHIPDKKTVFWIARTYYSDLLEAGIKVYEYEPGFVHSKIMVADGNAGTVGSVNLDYRSFYHHFECGVYLQNNSSIADIEKDFQETLTKCIEVTPDYKKKIPLYQKFIGRILRLMAPML